MAWLTGWKYRKRTSIPQNVGAEASFQVPLTVYYADGVDAEGKVYLNGKCKNDFSDVRVTDQSGETLQDIWLQSKTDGNNAVYWVEVRAALNIQPAELCVYYGNEGAHSVSSETDTFVDVLTGVVAAYPMNEGSGTTLTDYSGNGNDGTINGATWTANGLSFDGVDDWCLLPNNGQMLDLTGLAIVGKLAVTAARGAHQSWIDWAYWSSSGLTSYRHSTGDHIPTGLKNTLGNTGVVNIMPLSIDNWATYAFTWDNIRTRYFSSVSGLLVDGAALTGTVSILTATANVGRRSGAFDYFLGLMKGLFMFNHALTQQQLIDISSNYPDPTLEAGKVHVRKWVSTGANPTFKFWFPEEIEVIKTPLAVKRRERQRRERQRKKQEQRKALLTIAMEYFLFKQKNRKLISG
jgi:hypothetical protein